MILISRGNNKTRISRIINKVIWRSYNKVIWVSYNKVMWRSKFLLY